MSMRVASLSFIW